VRSYSTFRHVQYRAYTCGNIRRDGGVKGNVLDFVVLIRSETPVLLLLVIIIIIIMRLSVIIFSFKCQIKSSLLMLKIIERSKCSDNSVK
jgi:hypothetical protein